MARKSSPQTSEPIEIKDERVLGPVAQTLVVVRDTRTQATQVHLINSDGSTATYDDFRVLINDALRIVTEHEVRAKLEKVSQNT